MNSFTAAVITVSDKGFQGLRTDTSGPALRAMLEDAGYQVIHTEIVPDDRTAIEAVLRRCADKLRAQLILTTGGTGFSPRDVTPEATLAVAERLCPGIPEAMRSESLRITPRGCLSRSVAGIRGGSLIVNLPGSEKAAKENLGAVLNALGHGLEILASQGSADCAAPAAATVPPAESAPSLDDWLRQAKAEATAAGCGMYLIHNGVVRSTARRTVRGGEAAPAVTGMRFDYDETKVRHATDRTRAMEGVETVKVWLNRGKLAVGDDIMAVLVGGDTRPHVIAALESLVDEVKTTCVTEEELFG